MNIDDMTQAFLELHEKKYSIDSEDWTESDTRSKFIDRVLIDCLGWSEDDIRRELSSDRKRLDYLLSTTRPVMVVEAKKAAKEFPVLHEAKVLRCQMKRMLKTNPGLKEPLKQVVEYCRRFSTPLAVLTNGKTYITFIAVRTDGIPWHEGVALVVPDIYNKQFNFADFYNLLSQTTVMSGRLLSQLMVGELPVAPQNVLSTYADPNSIIQRNPIGLALEPLFVQVFSDVTREDSPEVLEHCYVLPGETTLRNEDFEALLLDKPPRFTEAVLDVSTRNSFEKFQESIKDYLSRSRWAQTVFIIGGLGVGKTMFLRRYFNVVAPSTDSGKDTCAFYIDFRKPELDPQKVPEFIFEKLKEQILALDGQTVPGETKPVKYDLLSPDGVQQVFWPQIQQFLKGPQGKLREIDEMEFEKCRIALLSRLQDDDRKFVKGAFRVLRERYHRNVCVVIDNADQCTPEYQKAVYIFSRNLEATLECLVIVALREEWYWHFGKSGGPLSAYHDMVYHIPAPRVRDVLRKRLDYSIQLLQEYQIPGAIAYLSGNIILEAKHLNKYLQACRQAFFENEDITVFYECLSHGNIRKGLDVFLDFLRSGHTHVDEYLRAFVSSGDYIIAFHQVFKPVSRGSYQYYCSSRSRIPNVFMPITGVSGMQVSYFSRLYLLNYLAFRSKAISVAGQGFVPLHEVDVLLSGLGISAKGKSELLKTLFDSELIESDLKMVPTIEDWSFIRITGLGLHLARVLVSRFSYIESVMLDTPVTNQAIHARISGLYLEGTKPSLHQRILCAKEFIAYLQSEETLEQMRVQSAGIGQHCPEVMHQVIGAAENQFNGLEKIAKEDPRMQDV